jgi:hypothetical protein
LTARRLVLALALFALAASATPVAAQCAMCRTALTQSPEGRAMASSLNRAILLLMAAPYLVFGAGAFVFLRRRRSAPGPQAA